MRNLATALVAAAGTAGLFQWSQIVYRLQLFFDDYHGEPGVNHIGNGDFALIYFANGLLLAVAAYGFFVFWRLSRGWCMVSAAVAAVNVLGWITLFVMHRTGALVEYGEFIRHMRGEM